MSFGVSMKRHFIISVLSCFFILSCSSDEPTPPIKKKSKSIHQLSEMEAETLLQSCFERVQGDQNEFGTKSGGKNEMMTIDTAENYRAKVSAKSYHSLDQRLKQFNKYKILNLNYSFWGSMQNTQGIYVRYVVTRYCTTNGVEITGTRQMQLTKLTS